MDDEVEPLVEIVVTRDGRVMRWNSGAEEIFGYSRAEAEGKHVFELIIPSFARVQETQRLRSALLDGSAKFDAIRQRKDGILLFMEVNMQALPDAKGVTMVLSVVR